jgi:hypothetical protein
MGLTLGFRRLRSDGEIVGDHAEGDEVNTRRASRLLGGELDL